MTRCSVVVWLSGCLPLLRDEAPCGAPTKNPSTHPGWAPVNSSPFLCKRCESACDCQISRERGYTCLDVNTAHLQQNSECYRCCSPQMGMLSLPATWHGNIFNASQPRPPPHQNKMNRRCQKVWDLLPGTLPPTCCGRPVTMEEGMGQQGVGCVAMEWEEFWVSKTKFQQWKHEIQKALKYKCVTWCQQRLDQCLTHLHKFIWTSN